MRKLYRKPFINTQPTDLHVFLDEWSANTKKGGEGSGSVDKEDELSKGRSTDIWKEENISLW